MNLLSHATSHLDIKQTAIWIRGPCSIIPTRILISLILVYVDLEPQFRMVLYSGVMMGLHHWIDVTPAIVALQVDSLESRKMRPVPGNFLEPV
jgi:hypothetical protein